MAEMGKTCHIEVKRFRWDLYGDQDIMFGVDLVLSLSISALVFIKLTCQFHFLADQVDLATVGCGFG